METKMIRRNAITTAIATAMLLATANLASAAWDYTLLGGETFTMTQNIKDDNARSKLTVNNNGTLADASTIIGNGFRIGDQGTGGANTRAAQLMGSGYLIVEGNLDLWADIVAGYAGATLSNFTGTLDVRGKLTVAHPDYTRNSTLFLNGGQFVSGSNDNIALNNVSGTGSISGLATFRVYGAFNPGTANAAGTIARTGNAVGLEFFPGSSLTLDIFGENNADLLDWSGANIDFKFCPITVNLHALTGDLEKVSWTLVQTNTFIAFPSAVTLDLAEGWYDVSYTAANGQLIVTGSYKAVPEPASLAFLGMGAAALLLRRKR